MCCSSTVVINIIVFLTIEPPRNVRVSDVSKTAVNLSWQKPPYDGGSKITGYIVEKRDLPNGRWTKASFTNVIETQFTVSGLTQNSQYEFRVFAKNAVGSISNPSDVIGPITCVDTYGKRFAISLPMLFSDTSGIKDCIVSCNPTLNCVL